MDEWKVSFGFLYIYIFIMFVEFSINEKRSWVYTSSKIIILFSDNDDDTVTVCWRTLRPLSSTTTVEKQPRSLTTHKLIALARLYSIGRKKKYKNVNIFKIRVGQIFRQRRKSFWNTQNPQESKSQRKLRGFIVFIISPIFLTLSSSNLSWCVCERRTKYRKRL